MERDYIIYGLTEDELKAVAKETVCGDMNNIRFVFDMFGRISHLETTLTPFKAARIRRQMRRLNRRDKSNHYELILKGAA